MEALIFGAGNIGRGFLGLLLSRSDFHTIFVDVDEIKVSLINSQREYPVFIVSEEGVEEQTVKDINAISISDQDNIINSIVSSDLILTAVGKAALEKVAFYLANGLVERFKRRPKSDIHVIVIACENVQDNTSYLKQLILSNAPDDYKKKINNCISFPNCVVDRIVPNTISINQAENPLLVTVEQYFQFAVDVSGLLEPMPKIEGVELSYNLSANLEQKLFTLNAAHAITGYYGFLRGYKFIHEAINDKEIEQLLKGAFAEVESIIISRHSNISQIEQNNYTQKIIKRFKNPYLQDEIIRVARDPLRKLGSQDRLIKPAHLLFEQGKTPSYITAGVVAALNYDYIGDSQAQILVKEIRQKDIEIVLKKISGLEPNDELSQLIKADFLLRTL